MPQKLNRDQARLVKEMLWRGRKQQDIQAATGASQSSVSRIKLGMSHRDIPWPDGSLGPMPHRGFGADDGHDWSVDARRFISLPEAMQRRVLEVVNAKRIEQGVEPLPAQSEDYMRYLQMDPTDAEFEALDLVNARSSEDKRLSLIMLEFDKIVDEQALKLRTNAIMDALEDTRRDPDLSQPGTQATDDLTYNRLDWKVVADRAPDNPIVLEASTSLSLMEACCVVFYQLRESPDLWTSTKVHEQIRRLARRFEEMPLLMERLRKEYGVE